jgi:hypothetical protein
VRQTEVFAERTDADGRYFRAVHFNEDGSLTIEGHDTGPGVEMVFGDGVTEYEFERSVEAAEVVKLREVLGVGAEIPLLAVLRKKFATTSALEDYLDDKSIRTEFWSRMGD